MPQSYDAVVLGGGPAGLQAALTLGRMHKSVLLLDSGEYRNAPADHLHNFVTRDGTPPAAFRAAARAELAGYGTVVLRDATATRVGPRDAGFRVEVADAEAADARAVVLATGVRDALPDHPGLAPLFGTVVAHCPFCHGHEYAGTHVAVVGSGPHVSRVALMMAPIAARVTVLADGGEPATETRADLDRAGIPVRPEPVKGWCRSATGATVTFTEGPDEEVGGALVATTFAQTAPFAQQLGLTMLPSGCVEVDALGRTSLPGVYAAGDLAHVAAVPMPFASVLTAAAAGLVAGSSVVADQLGVS